MSRTSGTARRTGDGGFSLVELLLVIVVLGVLAGIVVFGVGTFRGDSAAAADRANLQQLNVASTAYRAMATGPELDDLASDAARMKALFDRGLLTGDGSGSPVVSAQAEGAVFAWDPAAQAWILSLGAPDRYDFTAAGTAPSDYRRFGTWAKSGTSGFTSSYGQLFAPNPRAQYTASYTASLTPDSVYGGNALLLTSALTADNRDTGYAIQFDRGYGRGSIVIRSRKPDPANPNVIREPLVPGFTFDSGNTKGAIPDKDTPEGKAWWAASHVLSARVTAVDSTTRSVEYSIDGTVVFDNFSFTVPPDSSESFVGLRAWGDTSTFERLTVG